VNPNSKYLKFVTFKQDVEILVIISSSAAATITTTVTKEDTSPSNPSNCFSSH